MKILRHCLLIVVLSILAFTAFGMNSPEGKDPLPVFGKDTVLVWKIQNQQYQSSFVVRIAQFLPNR